jgi:hypothetical protein
MDNEKDFDTKKQPAPKAIKKSLTAWGKSHGKLSSALGAAVAKKIQPTQEMTEKDFVAMVDEYRSQTTFKRG